MTNVKYRATPELPSAVRTAISAVTNGKAQGCPRRCRWTESEAPPGQAASVELRFVVRERARVATRANSPSGREPAPPTRTETSSEDPRIIVLIVLLLLLHVVFVLLNLFASEYIVPIHTAVIQNMALPTRTEIISTGRRR